MKDAEPSIEADPFPASLPPRPALPPPPGDEDLTDDEREALRRSRISLAEVHVTETWWRTLLRWFGL